MRHLKLDLMHSYCLLVSIVSHRLKTISKWASLSESKDCQVPTFIHSGPVTEQKRRYKGVVSLVLVDGQLWYVVHEKRQDLETYFREELPQPLLLLRVNLSPFVVE